MSFVKKCLIFLAGVVAIGGSGVAGFEISKLVSLKNESGSISKDSFSPLSYDQSKFSFASVPVDDAHFIVTLSGTISNISDKDLSFVYVESSFYSNNKDIGKNGTIIEDVKASSDFGFSISMILSEDPTSANISKILWNID